MSLEELELRDPLVFDALRQRGQGKVDARKRLHFCGMIRLPGGRTAVFLPLALEDSGSHPSLTMAVLARYGRDVPDRMYDAEGNAGNCGFLSVVSRISDDFRAYGLFSERQRIRGLNAGKPDWARTIKRERLLPESDVFENLVTSRWIDSRETLIAQIQAVIIKEIVQVHGWWLEGLDGHRGRLRDTPRPAYPRHLWPALLQSYLPGLFSARAIRLTGWLIDYLKEGALSSLGPLVFGLDDFHTVWETMLRKTVNGVIRDINQQLPKAYYHPVPGRATAEAAQRSMLTDVVIRSRSEGRELHTILDAKYYKAEGSASLPGWPDIAKQMFYEKALRSVLGKDARIRNCFVFPKGDSTKIGRYLKVDMRLVDPHSQMGPIPSFPPIETVYLSMREVMTTYKQRGILDFPPSTSTNGDVFISH